VESIAGFTADPIVVLLAVTGVFLTGISKSGFAGGAGVIAVPLLAIVIAPTIAVVILLPLLLLMDAQTIAYHRRNLAFDELRLIVPAALIGVLIGSLALGHFSDALLQIIIGSVSLVFATIQLRTRTTHKSLSERRPVFAGVMGLIAGVTSSLIHSGGPPLNIYLATRQLPRALWISTAAVFFASINLSKVFTYAWVGLWQVDLLLISTLLVPVAVLGIFAGHRIQQKVSQTTFVRIIMIFLVISGLMLLFKGINAHL